jgi:nitrogen regulatory protein P-II 2
MKIITAFIRPPMLGKVTNALEEIDGFPGLTVTDVRGFGRRNIAPEEDIPLEEFIEKVRLEIVARDEVVKQIVDTVVRVAHTGKHGDGKVFVWPVEQAVRIRTGETDKDAI